VSGERFEVIAFGMVASFDCSQCANTERAAETLLSYPVDESDPMDTFTRSDEEAAGWQDAPDCCVSFFPWFVWLMGRLPSQRQLYMRTWLATHGRPHGVCHRRFVADSAGAMEDENTEEAEEKRLRAAVHTAANVVKQCWRDNCAELSCRMRRVQEDDLGVGSVGAAVVDLLDDHAMQTVMDETLQQRPTNSFSERLMPLLPLVLLFCYIVPVLYYIILFGSYHGSTLTLELQKGFWIAQATAAFVTDPLLQLLFLYLSVVILPVWIAAFGWLPYCPKASSPRRAVREVLSGRLERFAFIQAAGAASGLDPARAILAYSVAGVVGGAMTRKFGRTRQRMQSRRRNAANAAAAAEMGDGEGLLQESLTREFVVRRFRSVVQRVGPERAQQVLAAVEESVRDDILPIGPARL
jgi:hypothetical protein